VHINSFVFLDLSFIQWDRADKYSLILILLEVHTEVPEDDASPPI